MREFVANCRILLILPVILAVFYLPVQGGLVITEVIHEPGRGLPSESRMYFQDNLFKSVEESHTVIFDLEKREITFTNPADKTYWRGSLDSCLYEIRKLTLEHFKQEVETASPEDKPFYLAIYENLKTELEQPDEPVVFQPDVQMEIVMTDETETILDYKARKYEVFVEGSLREELWLTNEVNLCEDFDTEEFRMFINDMAWDLMDFDYQSTPEYIHLMKEGLVLRSVEYFEDGSVYSTEVVDVEQKDIPRKEFSPSPDYEHVSIDKLGLIKW